MIDAQLARGRRRRRGRNATRAAQEAGRPGAIALGIAPGPRSVPTKMGLPAMPAANGIGVSAALHAVSEGTLARLGELERTPAAITEGFLALWSDLLDRARLTMGCAVVAVSVAATGDCSITRARCSAGGRPTWQGC
jgi:hypothetical protein